ncbi:MAG: hypothetical protein JXQ76_10990 [Campylobacterales bacterium]|nr:hypothetical protein [Campylobacterales bacterium]
MEVKMHNVILDSQELELLQEIEAGEWMDKPLSQKELHKYSQSAKYTRALQQKKQTTIRFAVNDLAIVKAKAKEMGIGYQNLIQALVHNYAKGEIELRV